jgi:hypothetical protein
MSESAGKCPQVKTAVAMSKHTVYLEAPKRIQDLLNIKWALLSAGYSIGSSWHDAEAGAPYLGSEHHWNAKSVEQLQSCDSLVVICEKSNDAGMELATMAGFALASSVRVIWIGPVVRTLAGFRAVRQFDSAEEFRTEILRQVYSPSLDSVSERPAA